ncbi:hypothetical protein K474DRAFT_1659733 [Panus rudis PR-1116 ss-1]|nr:hypothetical protein K474DRAFT_1659733 [Panus rudis PR-1116 ss-1]
MTRSLRVLVKSTLRKALAPHLQHTVTYASPTSALNPTTSDGAVHRLEYQQFNRVKRWVLTLLLITSGAGLLSLLSLVHAPSSSTSGDMEHLTATASQLIGPFLILAFICLILYGTIIVQVYVYAFNSGSDPMWLKSMVIATILMETALTIFLMHQLYFITIISFGDYTSVANITWSAIASASVEVCIVYLVQCFYVRRLWYLSEKNIPLTTLIASSSLTGFACGIASLVYAYNGRTWGTLPSGPHFKRTLEAANGLTAATDGIIAGAMIYYLRQNRVGTTRSDNVLRWAMNYAINTGLLTMTADIAIAITFATLRGNMVFAGLVVISSRLHANSFLGTLNSRTVLRSKWAQDGHGMGRTDATSIVFERPTDSEYTTTSEQPSSGTYRAEESIGQLHTKGDT